MKRYFSLFLIIVFVLILLTSCGNGNKKNEENTGPQKTVTIGVFEPASGDNAAGGKQETLGILYANSVCPTVEVNGEEYKVELAIVDNESDNAKAVTTARYLVEQNSSIVLGSYGSAVSIAASGVWTEANIPVIGISCTNPQVTKNCSQYFRICYLDTFQGTVLANYAFENGMQKAYCLSKLGDDYSSGLVEFFATEFTKLGGEVVRDQFPDKNTDFAAYIGNAINMECDVFFAPVSTEAATHIIDEAKTQNLSIPILAGDTWDSNTITSEAKGSGLEIIVTTFYQEGGNKEFDDGIKKWMEQNPDALTSNGGNTDLSAVTAMGYDAYMVALEAIKAAGSIEPGDILTVLPSIYVTNLICGEVSFDETGDSEKNEAIIKSYDSKAGKWESIGTQTTGE